MAEAFGRHLAEDVFVSRSAGTCQADRINPSAQRLMQDLYGIDMEKEGQFPKKLEDLRRWTWWSPWAAGSAVRYCLG